MTNSRVLCVLFLLFVIHGATPARQSLAQAVADPFGGLVAVATEPTTSPDERSGAAAAILASITERSPSTAVELLRAVDLLQQVEEYAEAKKYLAQLQAQGLDQTRLAELHAEFGSGVIVRLASVRGLAPEGRDLAMSILSAATTRQRDPARLQSQLAALSDASPVKRRDAEIAIAAAGAEGVPVLLSALRDAPSDLARTGMRRALVRIGSRAEGPLIAAVGGGETATQKEAVRVLGYVGTRKSIKHLLRPCLVGDEEVRQLAAAALSRLGVTPPNSISSAVPILREQVSRYLGEGPPDAGDFEGRVNLWTWDAAKNNVVPAQLGFRDAAMVFAARLARDLVELDPSPSNTRLLLASRLETEQRLYDVDQQLPRGPGSARELARAAGVATINEVLAFCLEQHLYAGAAGAAELLGEWGDESMLRGASWPPLVLALRAPDRRVRYAAALAVMNIDPRRSYPGASYLIETLTELATVSGRSAALLGMPREDFAADLQGELVGLGFETVRTSEGKAFLRRAFESSDYDVLFLSEAIDCPPVSETLQQLRQDSRSELVPVVIVTRERRQEAAQRVADRDPLTIVMPELADQETITRVLGETADLAMRTSVPAPRRLEQASDALQWITHLVAHSQTYDFYDLTRVEPLAEAVLAVPGLSDDALDLLGYLGTVASQLTLVDVASSNAAPISRRQRAANAFAEAVLRRGLMLRRADVLAQYDRYNASAQSDQATQEVLGQLLDVIETQ